MLSSSDRSALQLRDVLPHARFVRTNPGASGIRLADGWFSAQRLARCDLRGAAVLLSACESGRVHVEGGDEPFGLTRSLLAAGASSITTTLWPVHDRATRDLMAEAYAAGIDIEFVTEIIRQFRVAPPAVATDRWPWPVKVHTLGRFELIVDGVTLEFSGKAPRKPLALLKAVVALGPNGVPVSALMDALWPEEEGDAARKSLDVTVARLRKLLGRNEAVIVGDEAVSLNPKLCWTDAQSFQALVEAARTPEEMRQACAGYTGTFLPGDIDAPWSAKRREGLRNRFICLVEDAGVVSEEQHDWDAAIDLYRRGLEADELAEAFHQGLMRCYRALGRHAESMSTYRRLRQTLSLTLGIAPSEHSQALARALQQDGAAL